MRMKNNLILTNSRGSSRAEESRAEKSSSRGEQSRQTDRQWQRQTKFVINAKSHVEQSLYTSLSLLSLYLSLYLSHFPLRCVPANYLKNLLNFHIRIKQQQPVSFNALLRCLPAGPGLRSLSIPFILLLLPCLSLSLSRCHPCLESTQ